VRNKLLFNAVLDDFEAVLNVTMVGMSFYTVTVALTNAHSTRNDNTAALG